MFGRQVVGVVIGIAISVAMGVLLISVFFYAANAATQVLPPLNETTTLGRIYATVIRGFESMAAYFPLLLLLGVVGLVAFIAIALYQIWERGTGGGAGRTRQLKLMPAVKTPALVFAKIPTRFYWY
jgi:hypothetical protein